MSEYLEATYDKFTFRVATDRLYAADGVWVFWIELQKNGRVRLGLTDYLQQHSGDMGFVSVKPVGTKLVTGDEFATVETIKTTLSLYSPLAGAVVDVNEVLDLTPEIVNQDPYGKGWLTVVEAASWDVDRVKLLDSQAYFSVMRSQIEQELKQS